MGRSWWICTLSQYQLPFLPVKYYYEGMQSLRKFRSIGLWVTPTCSRLLFGGPRPFTSTQRGKTCRHLRTPITGVSAQKSIGYEFFPSRKANVTRYRLLLPFLATEFSRAVRKNNSLAKRGHVQMTVCLCDKSAQACPSLLHPSGSCPYPVIYCYNLPYMLQSLLVAVQSSRALRREPPTEYRERALRCRQVPMAIPP